MSCTPNLSLKIIVEENCFNPDSSNLKIYLLEPKENEIFTNIIMRGRKYLDSLSRVLNDSLRILKTEFEDIDQKRYSAFDKYIKKSESITREYTDFISLKPLRIQRYENVWQLWVEFQNQGIDAIESLNLTVSFEDQVLIKDMSLQDQIAPGNISINGRIYFDLSENLPLHMEMASYPGGKDQLINAIKCEINSVSSDFTKTLYPYIDNINFLDEKLDEISIEMELFDEKKYYELGTRVIEPANRILEQNLKELYKYLIEVSTFDTVSFDSLRSNIYTLVAYTSPLDTTQWHSNIDTGRNNVYNVYYLSRSNRRYFFLHLLKQPLKSRQPFPKQ